MRTSGTSPRTKSTASTAPARRPVRATKAKKSEAVATIVATDPEMIGSRLAPTGDEIARRAYEIFLSRDGAPGDPTADWLQAERELM